MKLQAFRLLSIAGLVVGILAVLCSCTYRFSNLNVNLHGIESISVESVFNTSSTPSPYELLWHSMQEQIIKDGHLRLRSSKVAQATVSMVINKLEISPTGTATTSFPEKDPSVPASPDNPIPVDDFMRLSQAYSYNTENVLILDVSVAIYNLQTRKVLFDKRYRYSENMSSLYNYHYPVYKEVIYHNFKKLSDKIAYNTINDFLYPSK